MIEPWNAGRNAEDLLNSNATGQILSCISKGKKEETAL